MKKLFLAAGFILGLGMVAFADQSPIWLSSNTAVNISTTNIVEGWVQPGTSVRGILHGVCINTAAAGSVQIFNSSGTANNTITGVLSTATQEPCNFYDVAISSGLSVNKNGTADITILYQMY